MALLQLKLKLKMNGSSILVNGREALAQSKGSNTAYNRLSLALAVCPLIFSLFCVCNRFIN